MKRKPLGQILRELGLITEDQLNTALAEQKQWGHPLGRTLIELGMVEEDAIVRVLSHQLKLPAVQLAGFEPDPKALRLLDADFCRQQACLPLRYNEERTLLHIAMADHHLFDKIRVRAKCNLRPYLAGPVAIDQAIQRVYLGAQLGTPALRTDEPIFELEPAFDEAEVEASDPTDYVDLESIADLRSKSHIDPDADLESLQNEILHLRNAISRLAELLISKGVCVPDEVNELIRS